MNPNLETVDRKDTTSSPLKRSILSSIEIPDIVDQIGDGFDIIQKRWRGVISGSAGVLKRSNNPFDERFLYHNIGKNQNAEIPNIRTSVDCVLYDVKSWPRPLMKFDIMGLKNPLDDFLPLARFHGNGKNWCYIESGSTIGCIGNRNRKATFAINQSCKPSDFVVHSITNNYNV